MAEVVTFDTFSDGKTISLYEGSSDTLVVTWKATANSKFYEDITGYEILWRWTVYSDGSIWEQEKSTIDTAKTMQSTFSISNCPSNALKIHCKVSITWKDSKKCTYTHSSSREWAKSDNYWPLVEDKPEQLSAPSVSYGSKETDGTYKMKAQYTNISDQFADYVHYYFATSSNVFVGECWDKVSDGQTTGYIYVSPGSNYKVKAQAVNVATEAQSESYFGTAKKASIVLANGNEANKVYDPLIYGDYSDWSDATAAAPDVVSDFKVSAYSETSIRCTWTKAEGATGYEIQYATVKAYLKSGTGDTSSVTVDNNVASAYITDLESGKIYYLRIRATNDTGESSWSDYISITIGTTPEAPTTWSSTTVNTIGKTIYLYWVHNCEDSSDQTGAEIQLTVYSGGKDNSNGSTNTITISDDSSSYTLDTSTYSDGTVIEWCVRTEGITGEFGDWSIVRTITLYAPVTLGISMDSTVTSFPINVKLQPSTSAQTIINYYVSITAKSYYETTNAVGQTVYIGAGEEIFSKLYNTSENPYTVVISVGDLYIESGEDYTFTATVATSAGLTAEISYDFTVNWVDLGLYPNASVYLNKKNLTSYIKPICYDEDYNLASNVTLGVYRREADGTFTKIADGLENTLVGSISDPHPSLDYARYRITAQSTKTGQIVYIDLPGLEVHEPSIIIQWSEEWTNFDYSDPDDYDEEESYNNWSGSMAKIPYNVDVSEAHSLDRSAIEYIGREHPVSYYGTQTGETGSWSVEIPKSDKELIYSLRRLAAYMGDAYVREPSGIGYWAQVSVTIDSTHCETTVPVSFDITRVEGGV